MGLKAPPARSTLSDALNQRDWRIYHALAQRLIVRARALYAQDSVLDLDASVYALDSTTIDLCLSLFEWAPFRSTKAAIKLHTLLDLRGAIPAFIHISDGKLHDVNVLDILPVEAGAFYVMDRGYVDFARLYAMHQAGAFFVTRAKSGMDARRVYSATTDRSTGVICDQRVMLNGFYSAKHYPEHLRRVRSKDPESGKTLVFLTNNTTLHAHGLIAKIPRTRRWRVTDYGRKVMGTTMYLREHHFPNVYSGVMH
jgi:Transposase DDE domain